MTTKEFYEKTGGDYAGSMERLGSDDMLQHFSRKFSKDPSFAELTHGFAEQNAEKAFRAAHTLKGICLNLGFTRLYRPAAALTEDLRGRSFSAQSEDLYHAVEKEYAAIVEALSEWE